MNKYDQFINRYNSLKGKPKDELTQQEQALLGVLGSRKERVDEFVGGYFSAEHFYDLYEENFDEYSRDVEKGIGELEDRVGYDGITQQDVDTAIAKIRMELAALNPNKSKQSDPTRQEALGKLTTVLQRTLEKANKPVGEILAKDGMEK